MMRRDPGGATEGGSTELVLVRHGAVLAERGFVAGNSDPALSARGAEEARLIAARLTDESIAALFVTPLRRTAQTAQPLAAAIGIEPTVIAELREVRLGRLESSFATAAGADLMREVLRRERWDIASDAESMEGFAARVERGLLQLTDVVGPGLRVVAFVHGGVIAEACRQATGSRPLAFLPNLRHGSITRLRRQGARTTLMTFNDVAHLQPIPDAA